MNVSNQNISEKFTEFFKARNLLQGKFLAAVSGGIDSVVLCELCKKSGIQFAIAHCNFGLRGEESDRDENFVRSLGKKYGVEVFVKKFDTETYANEKKVSIQEAARDLRYHWFVQLKKKNGFSFTLLAHHADDNIETLLMNFFRGTGLQGLTAMPEENLDEKFFLRPLLGVRRKEILEFAKQNNLDWVEDSSNLSSKYTRNFFRNELLPAIQKVFPQAEENLLDNIDRFKQINALYQTSVEELKKKVCEQHASEIRIPILKLMKYRHTSLIYEIIKDYGFGEKQVDEVIKLADADSGKFIGNEKYQIIKHRNWFIIAPRAEIAETIAIEEGMENICFGGGKLELKTISKEKFQLQKKETIAQLDAKHIEYPLILRKWKQGDYFYPLGMRKKKKLARFFIDKRLPKNQKENIWVLESNKKIVWIVGMRIDDRFKVTESTKKILKLTANISQTV
ncbi:MAG TPA: tRNA lysidine(34) synthetase TilS [Flavisolibacter sp.]|nr:tRNA lysidine(34) synthetase TilS [Flavisolibacter sp.]